MCKNCETHYTPRQLNARRVFFIEQANISLRLAATSDKRATRDAWLDQARSELERAGDAAQALYLHVHAQ